MEETAVILLGQENPDQDLSTPGQPLFALIPKSKLMDSSLICSAMLYKGIDQHFDRFDSILYDPENTIKPKQHIKTNVVYLGQLFFSELGQSQAYCDDFAALNDQEMMAAIRVWTEGTEVPRELKARENAIVAARFLGLPEDFRQALESFGSV